MEVAVRIPPAGDFFTFDSPCSSHYLTAPSSPHRFSKSSISAPTSPSHSSNFHRHDDYVGSPSAVPFRWEEKPGIPKSPEASNNEDFEFNFSAQFSDKPSLSADELFDGGKIKPLKPPPAFHFNDFSSPRSPQNLKLSPRLKNHDVDPFEAAILKETTRSHSSSELCCPEKRGRHRTSYLSSSFVRKGTRSLSPFRVSETELDDQEDSDNSVKAKSSTTSSFLSSISFSKSGNRKWKLRDLLFRSVSEGRATEKDDRFVKFEVTSKKVEEGDVENSTFRSPEGGVSEELKKRRGILGCLGFNRTGVYEISRGIGSLTRG